MKKLRITLLLIATATSLVACIEQFDFPFQDVQNGALVVEGVLTSGSGPYTVRLSRTRSYQSLSGSFRPAETGAEVVIADNTGNREVLTEISQGEYQTSLSGIQGVAGNEYTLIITTADGEVYQSRPAVMPSVVEIDQLSFEYGTQPSINEADQEVDIPGIFVYLATTDPIANNNYYLWNWKGVYEVRTFPELHTDRDQFGNVVPDPKDCCSQCWVLEYSGRVNISDDDFFNGQTLQRQELGFIPMNTAKLTNKYQVEVEQLSLTQEGFTFWSGVNDQQNNVGSIFDPAPARIQGNIFNVSDPDELVLGYFTISDKTSAIIEITPTNVGGNIPQSAPVEDDCSVLRGAQVFRPSNY